MTIFSERQGIRQPKNLDPNAMPAVLRNRLWNVVKDYIDKEFHGDVDRNYTIEYVWDKFFKENKDELKSWISYR